MKRVVYLVTAALVALMICVPLASAQITVEQTKQTETKIEGTAGPLPKSGGPAVSTMLLPAAALLVGSGILAYSLIRRRR